MNIAVKEIGADSYRDYANVPEWFLVESILECGIVRGGLGGFVLRETPVAAPYRKYCPGEGPADWAKTHDLTKWGIFLATADGQPAGGAAVAPPAPGIIVTEGRKDTSGLFDIRVALSFRRHGVGTALLGACADWSRARGFRFLGIETQNTNIPACRFYARSGCELADIRRFAYEGCPEVSNESMLIWRLDLSRNGPYEGC